MVSTLGRGLRHHNVGLMGMNDNDSPLAFCCLLTMTLFVQLYNKTARFLMESFAGEGEGFP